VTISEAVLSRFDTSVVKSRSGDDQQGSYMVANMLRDFVLLHADMALWNLLVASGAAVCAAAGTTDSAAAESAIFRTPLAYPCYRVFVVAGWLAIA